jgi:chloride channel protein, CIC family
MEADDTSVGTPSQAPARDPSAGLVRLAVVAAAGGVGAGLIGALFRLSLTKVELWWLDVTGAAHSLGTAGILVPVLGVAVAAAVARFIVRLVPTAGGSGIQRVEGVMRDDLPPAPVAVIPAKFIGSLFALGAGLLLGREGPTVQLGAAVGQQVAVWTRTTDEDMRAIQAATAGAGLAVAFTAPLGGAMFTFEEVGRRFTPRLVVASLVACSVAASVAAAITGVATDFHVTQAPPTVPFHLLPVVAVFGALLGLGGAFYSRLILALLAAVDRLGRVPPEATAAAIGAVVGLVLWLDPALAGGGEAVTQRVLNGGFAIQAMTVLLLVRFALGPLSYAAGTPGGLFAPILALGALAGAVFAAALGFVAPGLAPDPVACSLIGMATLLTVVVRAPFTGLLLVIEMTGTTSQVVPMLLASGASMLVTAALRSEPIYDSLKTRMLAVSEAAALP